MSAQSVAAPPLTVAGKKPSRASFYLVMPDGVRLAVDVVLPAGQAGPVPTVLHQTRYYRGVAMRPGFGWIPLGRAMDSDFDTRARFVAAGYAWVSVCVRGSGASGGWSPYPWSTDEVADGGRVLDWIVAQPWSNGRVGATGISYAGTSAELLANLGHPALKAIAPRFSCFDVYADVAFPGGLHLESFTRSWGALNQHLDSGDIGAAVALNLGLSGRGSADLAPRLTWLRAMAHPWAQAAVRGVIRAVAAGAAGVHGDPRRAAVRAAIAEHAHNEDIHASALRITHRDDAGFSLRVANATVDTFSPHQHFRAHGLPVLGYSGWLDGGYAAAAAKRHQRLGGEAQLVLGPWNHGGQQNICPGADESERRDDHPATLLAFFDRHVRGLETEPTPRVRYYTLGEQRWKDASEWPPPNTALETLYLAGEGALSFRAPPQLGTVGYRVDPHVGTGHRARWDSLLGLKAPTGYGDGTALCARAQCFTTPPLGHSLEVTGHPRAAIALASSLPDGALFLYLVDVAPSGRATVVTEGQLRLLHRRVASGAPPYPNGTPRSYLAADAQPMPVGEAVTVWVDLLPTSYRFAAGHAVRLAITGADAHHFAAVTPESPSWQLYWGGAEAPRLELPTPAPLGTGLGIVPSTG